jgi:hypothetical protein
MSGIEPVQEYNEYIKRQLLDAIQRGIVGGLPQPTMFGGKRMRNFVLPSSTEYDYPSSLSVGHLGASQPDMLGGSFWNDFGKGVKQGVSAVGQVALPIAKEVGTELAKDAIRSYAKGGRRRKKGGFLVGRDGMIRPQAEGGYIGMTGNPYNESGFGSPNTQLDNFPHFYSGGVMCGAGVWDSFKQGFTQVGHALAPVAKEVFHDVVVPEGKEYLKDQIKEYKSGKGGSKNSALIAKMIGNQRKSFKIDRVSRPSGNAISFAQKAFGQKYKGRKPSDMWNTYKGEIRPQEAPKKRGRKPKAPVAVAPQPEPESESDEESVQNEVIAPSAVVPHNPAKGVKGRKPRGRPPKKGAKGTADIRGFFSGKGRDEPLTGGDVLGDIGKVGQAVAPFLPLLMGLGRGDPLPPHPIKGGNWADDLGKVSQAVAPFAPLLLGLGRGKMPSKTAINRIIKCGGNWADDLGKVSQAIAPFAPLLMGLGRGGNWADDLGKVSSAIAPFAPLLMAMGRGGSLSGKAIRRSPIVGADGHGILPFQPVVAKKPNGAGRKKGGVLIKDDPSQFQINTGLMPPALASYNPPVPSISGKGKGGNIGMKKQFVDFGDSMSGKGRKQLPHSGKKRESARGAIVAEVMKKHGLNLPQASKYVKEHGLY